MLKYLGANFVGIMGILACLNFFTSTPQVFKMLPWFLWHHQVIRAQTSANNLIESGPVKFP